eukprot:TRINITY_DN12530_c0_g1_i22.p1 TRINITY_DN12530_c0_g1~~TRINITY_DN12530_c0_g1_i22.p1  ORF type:complete len:367 (+),score=61.06 TRINITY_DN12530_c0_g1_i22:110-1210(+)
MQLFALMALLAAAKAFNCEPGSEHGKATATCDMADGSKKMYHSRYLLPVSIRDFVSFQRFDLTGAFTDTKGNPYLTSPSTDGSHYIFYVTAILPGLDSNMNLPMCRFDDGFTDSNSGAQAENRPSGGDCWSTGNISTETWTYDEVTQTMTIESIDGQGLRRTILKVVCSPSSTPQITTEPEFPVLEYNFKILHNSACISTINTTTTAMPTTTAVTTPLVGDFCQPVISNDQAVAECQGNQMVYKIDVTAAFIDCDGSPFLTSYATDNADKYYLSAIWPSVPNNITGCTFSGSSPIVRQADTGKCTSVASSFGSIWKYDINTKTLQISFSQGQGSLRVICSADTIPRVSYSSNLDFHIHHESACHTT